MNPVSKIALSLALSLGGTAVVATAPLAAQKKEQPAQPELQLSKAEREALIPLETAFTAGDYATATTALNAAAQVVTGADAKHFVAQYRYQLGIKTSNFAMQADGLEALATAGKLDTAQQAEAYGQIAYIAFNQLRDVARAERALTREVELQPNDPQALSQLARVKRELKKPQEVLPLLQRAITAQKASGQPVPESWLKLALDNAYTAKSTGAFQVSRDLLGAYPTKQNWRDALLVYREIGAPDPETNIDTYRLMRAADALSGERDYMLFADTLDKRGLTGETSAVLDEGVRKGMLDSAKAEVKAFVTRASARAKEDRPALAGEQATALGAAAGTQAAKIGDTLLGFGDYAKAAELYRAALQKGSVDANQVNTRLGIALALAGQKAEAESAFRAVTGPRAELANFWLVWLAQRA